MTEREDPRPIPWGLVEHVHRSKSGKTVMAISLPIETRARLAQAALDLGCSKLALIRAAIGQYLILHEENRSRGQEMAYAAVSGASDPVPGVAPLSTEPEPELVLEPIQEPEPTSETDREVPPVPVKAPSRRARKGKS